MRYCFKFRLDYLKRFHQGGIQIGQIKGLIIDIVLLFLAKFGGCYLMDAQRMSAPLERTVHPFPTRARIGAGGGLGTPPCANPERGGRRKTYLPI